MSDVGVCILAELPNVGVCAIHNAQYRGELSSGVKFPHVSLLCVSPARGTRCNQTYILRTGAGHMMQWTAMSVVFSVTRQNDPGARIPRAVLNRTGTEYMAPVCSGADIVGQDITQVLDGLSLYCWMQTCFREAEGILQDW